MRRMAKRTKQRMAFVGLTSIVSMVMLSSLTGWLSEPIAFAGQATQYVPIPPLDLPNPQGFVTALSPAVCREGNVTTDQNVPDGGFVRALTQTPTYYGTDVKIDSATGAVTGHCDVYNWGHYASTQYRYINAIKLTLYPPVSLSSYHPLWGPWPPPQTDPESHDTRNAPPGSGPFGTRLSEWGEHRFTFQTTVSATGCNFPTSSGITELFTNAVTCKPIWWRHPVSGKIFRVPPTAVHVYINPSMWEQLAGPAMDAANDWNAKLAGTGVTFEIVNYDCGGPTGGGDCAIVQEGDVAGGCAETLGPDMWDGSTGVRTTPGYIVLPTNVDRYWRNRSADRLKRTMSHELGHLLGLGDYDDACQTSANKAIMAPVSDPTCTSTTGMVLAPNLNDSLPTKTTYRYPSNPVTRVCGF
jgi:hypothetical protein